MATMMRRLPAGKPKRKEMLDLRDVGVSLTRDAVAYSLTANGRDENYLRPYIAPEDGRAYYLHNYGTADKPDFRQVPYTGNLTAQLRDNWLTIDEEVMDASAPELTLVQDIISAGRSRTIDGMATPVHAYQYATDITEAYMGMDPLKRAQRDKPELGLAGVPIPLIWKDLEFGQRELAIATRGSRPFPIDTYTLRLAARKCAQMAEQFVLGNISFSHQGYTAYGLRNHPSRLTGSLTLPTAAGWTPQTLYNELIQATYSLRQRYQRGPYNVYISPGWTPYLDMDYTEAYGGPSLSDKLLKLRNVKSIQTVDYMPDYEILVVDLTRESVMVLMGMQPRVVQWSEWGGAAENWRSMLSITPWLRPDSDGFLGVNHLVAA